MSLLVGLALAQASCGGGGTGGGRMYPLTCTLGCTSGEGGAQVSCGIVNTFQNQDIAVLFSERVDLAWILANANTFQVIDTSTAIAPPGGPLLDPVNPRRLIWRPELSFDADGNPEFGFEDGASYLIRVPGTSQGDSGPYVQSVDGKRNESRILCTITTDQGVVDPVPGAPIVDIYVTEIDGVSGLPKPGTKLEDVTNTVASTSPITFVFRDIMNLGTVINPTTKLAPFITVKVDPDGNLADPTDQQAIDGSYTFNVDMTKLETTAVFTPDVGYPSAGAGYPANPRLIVINLPASIIDLKSNSLANGGIKNFIPELQTFPATTIPAGGEQFVNTANRDPMRTGADWGVSQAGRLKPGAGGGSGRMGDLVVGPGEVVTLYTSKQYAKGWFDFAGNPANTDKISFDDGVNPQEVVIFRNSVNPGNFHTQREAFTSYTLAQAVYRLPDMKNDPGATATPIIDQVDFHVEHGNRLVVTSKAVGSAGENIVLDVDPTNGTTITPLSPTGAVDTNSFGGPGQIGEGELVTNFDFQANPGGTPPPITTINDGVDDGIFEFASVEIQTGGTLRFVGDNPAQLLVRGSMILADSALIDLAGASVATHASEAPLGQRGGLGGPGGGFGGDGADRPDNTGSDLLSLPTNSPASYDAGVENPAGIGVNGHPGLGVGLVFNSNRSGLGGAHWPDNLPSNTTAVGGVSGIETDTNCDVQQIGSPGSGGAYATAGEVGVPLASTPLSAQGGTNVKGDTPAPDGTGILEAAGTTTQVPPTPRTLSPRAGYLRGGSGGGSGASHVYLTSTDGVDPNCIVPPSAIDVYRSHSGAAGGGSGGALQIQVGGTGTFNGVIDASGGDGGSFDPAAPVNGTSASPGGAGSGGAVLLQAGLLDVSVQAGRLLIGGGTGGLGEFGSTGGDGGTGIVRAESLSPLTVTEIAAAIDPVDPMDPTSLQWLSTGTWLPDDRPPESFSGAESCWMRPAGSFFALNFRPDTDPVNGPFGWNMDLILDTGGGPMTVAYRGSTVFGGDSPQTYWGELFDAGLASAPVVVRFQGATSTGTITTPCDLDLQDPNAPIVPGSLTPWVRHPEELDQYVPKPDMVRFVIIFDASHADFSMIQGLTNLRIFADPD